MGYLIVDWPEDTLTPATLGDSFGVVNTLFSGLAFSGLIYTIHVQRKELELQRIELSNSTKQLEEQKEIMKKSTFENLFFHLINLHRQIGISLEATLTYINKQTVYANIQEDLEGFYLEYINRFSHYLHNIETLLDYIETSNIKNKELYVKIFKSILSQEELVLLYFYRVKYEKLDSYVKKYKLLDNLNLSLIYRGKEVPSVS